MSATALYANAPAKIKVGRVLLIIGSILFFVTSVAFMVMFFCSLYSVWDYSIDWNDASDVFSIVSAPFLAVFYVFAGIGGLCYVFDKHRMKVIASLAGVVMLVVIAVSVVIMFRDLIKDCLQPNANTTAAVTEFFVRFGSIQITGGVYFIGWFLTKDYTGD